jgi:hypothetical protein
MYLVVFYVGEYVWVCGCVGVGVWVCGCVYKIENFRTLSAPSEIASLREAISSSAAFEYFFKVALLLFRNKKRFRRNNFTSNSRNLPTISATYEQYGNLLTSS